MEKISDCQRHFLHSIGKLVVFSSRPWNIDQHEINKLIIKFIKYHYKKNDCKLLAEAELSGMKIIMTNDSEFIKNLFNHTRVLLQRPSEFLEKLNIPPGTPPVRRPDKSNPLALKNFWRI